MGLNRIPLIAVIGMSAGLAACGEAPHQMAFFESEALAATTFPPTLSSLETLTPAQLRARKAAQDYLKIMGYSRSKLIEALSSDTGLNFSRIDAIAAVDSLEVDWDREAVRTAQSYLNMMPFSCKGLTDQLSMNEGSGFTKHQAEYGARMAGAC